MNDQSSDVKVMPKEVGPDATSGLSAVRAKMVCNRTERTDFGGTMHYTRAHMGAIYGTEGENADYAKATPSGECWLQIDEGVPAAGFFKPGKRYYVTFTEAPD